MNRLGFVLALTCALVTVSSACVAQSPDWIQFTLEPGNRDPGKIRASFHDRNRDSDRNEWSCVPGGPG